MTYGFLSDVHGDLDGLCWALDSLAGADQVYCLGDLCGGREVRACLELLRARAVICVPGNHDLWEFELSELLPEQREFLAGWPISREVEDWLAVHSDFEQDEYGLRFPYIHSEADARRAFAHFPQRLIFFGHTHLSQVHCLEPDGTIRFTRAQGACPLRSECRYLVNVGATTDTCLLYDTEKAMLDYRFRVPKAPVVVPRRPWWRLFG
ncbi:MAG: metallophosphoesterase [Candidatus Eremiobacteraeota bacterium]|nr:metallophosphoesterase [Candidatus Eremiobacteraeota bacterium]MCW5872923.1 metallophosphoesterase [Candidatus Eremiobacteraeota bacterium]